MRVILIFLIIFLIGAIISWALGRLFSRKPILKYLPALPTLCLALYYGYQSTQTKSGFEDLAQLLLALMIFDLTLGIIITGLFMDYLLPKLKK